MTAPLHLLVAHAADVAAAGSGMACVASNCAGVLQECVKDAACLRGLGCFVACAAGPNSASDAPTSSPPSEGACQVRCVDLYESERLNAFTKCTLTDHGCYPALPADPRYPRLPRGLAETSDAAGLRRLLSGRWYVSAGLNPAFDGFACQVHDFAAAASDASSASDGEEMTFRTQQGATVPIADATFSYRVAVGGSKGGRGYVTRVGQKRLYLRLADADETQPSSSPSPSFRAGAAWGRDAFDASSPPNERASTTGSSRASATPNRPEAQLVLTTVPDYMNYEDEWTILSAWTADGDVRAGSSTATESCGLPFLRGRASDPGPSAPSSLPSTDYMVVAYRGRNSAWLGYGGLNVYTRRPVNVPELASSTSSSSSAQANPGDEALLRGIQRGLDKVGLTIADLLPVDHDGC